jgi:predicted dithiol-disulfide oxidoreductase (DUF899 family)
MVLEIDSGRIPYMKAHPIVTREEWLSARKALLIEEKKQTRARDELARQRRELPWVRIEKPYVFDGSNEGKHSANCSLAAVS